MQPRLQLCLAKHLCLLINYYALMQAAELQKCCEVCCHGLQLAGLKFSSCRQIKHSVQEVCLTLPGLTEYEVAVVLDVVVFGSFASLSSMSLLPGFAEED